MTHSSDVDERKHGSKQFFDPHATAPPKHSAHSRLSNGYADFKRFTTPEALPKAATANRLILKEKSESPNHTSRSLLLQDPVEEPDTLQIMYANNIGDFMRINQTAIRCNKRVMHVFSLIGFCLMS